MTTLSQAVQNAEYLSAERELALVAKAKAGDKRARDQLCTSHLKLVAAFAARYKKQADFDDLMSVGICGLIKAIDRFDPSRGNRLSTPARWWIRAEMLDYLMTNRSLVKIGTTSQQKTAFHGLGRAKSKLGIDGTNLTPDQVSALAAELQIPESVAAEMNARLQSDLSLNVHITTEEGTRGQDTWQDHLEDTSLVPQDETMIDRESAAIDLAQMEAALSTLKPRERYILEQRFLSEPKATLEILSRELGVSRERCRQVEVVALAKVRAHANVTPPKTTPAKRTTPSIQEVREGRKAFVRKHKDSMSVADMAAALNVSTRTVSSYVRRIERERLPLAA